MNETSAREAVLLQVLESAGTDSLHWTAQDGAWASRVALEAVGAGAPADRFIAERAHHALQRLAAREPAVDAALKLRVWRGSWWAWAAAVGCMAGLLADAVGRGQYINVLAPPLWGVVVWNLAVYMLLLWGALRGVLSRRSSSPGVLARGLQRLMSTGRPAGRATVLQAFGSAWAHHSAPLTAARAVGVLHVVAAALALGLLAGMYLRGLVLDYRAGWESTFLTAEQVHAALSLLLAPAVAVSGTPLTSVAGLEALRHVPGQATAGAPAAVWIHWYALTLLMFVVLPRAVLALGCAWRARGLARRFPLALAEAYFRRLVRHQHGGAARVWVLPYAQAPGPLSEQGLRAVLARLYGDAVQVHVAQAIAFGAEDDPAMNAPMPPGTTLTIALFDLTATPEAENQGRFVELLGAAQAPEAGLRGAPSVVILVDEAAFVQRFGLRSDRLAPRRAAWQQLADRLGCSAVFVNLAAPDVVATEQALQAASASAPLSAEAGGAVAAG